ncbi:hypothetical protein IVA78_05510 [Bradyrhizobium sp. 137]|uniref:hypothetical protein n=1 Tax=Bradyrhizobium sp. 137 TaxID=2782614 RepID=UPI001FFAA6C6|nr:hypothetical protein [Bradyrhizobium sp. 137]MCK1754675.1 hypothetical protein [Bradyrhizobium sp. 137]
MTLGHSSIPERIAKVVFLSQKKPHIIDNSLCHPITLVGGGFPQSRGYRQPADGVIRGRKASGLVTSRHALAEASQFRHSAFEGQRRHSAMQMLLDLRSLRMARYPQLPPDDQPAREPLDRLRLQVVAPDRWHARNLSPNSKPNLLHVSLSPCHPRRHPFPEEGAILLRCAAETLATIATDLKHLGAQLRVTAVLHT